MNAQKIVTRAVLKLTAVILKKDIPVSAKMDMSIVLPISSLNLVAFVVPQKSVPVTTNAVVLLSVNLLAVTNINVLVSKDILINRLKELKAVSVFETMLAVILVSITALAMLFAMTSLKDTVVNVFVDT